jgi:phage-related protein (TIGR01555 family)
MSLDFDFVTMMLNRSKADMPLSVSDSISDHKDEMDKLAQVSSAVSGSGKRSVRTKITDAYGNPLSAIGTDDKVKSFANYGFSNDTLNWTLWLALYNDSWVFRRAIDRPSQDMVNCGFTLHGTEDYTEVYRLVSRYRYDLIQLLQWGALFGGSVGVMMFDGVKDEDLAKPIDLDRIRGKRMRLYVTDRWYGVAESNDLVTNMRDIDFGKPVSYGITFADGHMAQVNHSYVLRYEHRSAPQLIKRGPLMGWGYAEGSHILNELSRDDQLKASITSLVNKSLIEIIKMSGMRGVFMGTDKGNEDQLRKRLEMVNWGRTYNSLTFLDKDDDYQSRELGNISGLSDLLKTNMKLVAAAVDMPDVLFGDMENGGLAHDSDTMRRYAGVIKNRCDSLYRPVMQKLLTVLFAAYNINSTPDFDFNSLTQDVDNEEKMKGIGDFVGVLTGLSDKGIISKYQVAASVKDFVNRGAVSIDFTEEQLNKLKYEEEAEILATYKAAGKAAPVSILGNQLGGGSEGGGLPDTLDYLNGIGNDDGSGRGASAPEPERRHEPGRGRPAPEEGGGTEPSPETPAAQEGGQAAKPEEGGGNGQE